MFEFPLQPIFVCNPHKSIGCSTPKCISCCYYCKQKLISFNLHYCDCIYCQLNSVTKNIENTWRFV